MRSCECKSSHQSRRIVLTGGPGAGKTAVLELVRQYSCRHIAVLPEAAGILFGGGFPRKSSPQPRKAAQRAIFYVQRELERATQEEGAAIILCDRGTLDGLAYWPDEPETFFREVGANREEQLTRYDAVIHLRPPPASGGYNHQNTLRIETALEAAALDGKIAHAWEGHPRRFFVESTPNFLEKASRALAILRGELPPCCQNHIPPAVEPNELNPR
jgi:predicted ATPase